MSSAIIGCTGFVGSNLVRQYQFDYFYNSQNIESISNKTFDLLVCSGAPAIKWLANKDPEKDWENINRLITCLSQVSAKKVILISTVDVYPSPIGVDEGTEINTECLHPYGKHRLELEKFINQQFNTLTVRLPGLFGKGLKKNIIYDFLYHNCVDQIHKNSIFQFYNLDYLWKDINIFLSKNLALVNIATEPTSVWEVAKESFGFDFENQPANQPAIYDFRTKYSYLLNSSDSLYMYTKQQVLSDIQKFILSQKEVHKNEDSYF